MALNWNEITEGIKAYGIRNGAQTTVAPTGTISTVEIQFYIPSSCIFRSLNVRAGTAGNNGNILHTLRKNRVNTVLTANLLANTTSANNAANLSVSFAAGDLLSISGVLSSAAGTEPNNISIVCEYY